MLKCISSPWEEMQHWHVFPSQSLSRIQNTSIFIVYFMAKLWHDTGFWLFWLFWNPFGHYLAWIWAVTSISQTLTSISLDMSLVLHIIVALFLFNAFLCLKCLFKFCPSFHEDSRSSRQDRCSVYFSGPSIMLFFLHFHRHFNALKMLLCYSNKKFPIPNPHSFCWRK